MQNFSPLKLLHNNYMVTVAITIYSVVTGSFGCSRILGTDGKFGLATFPSKYTSRLNCEYFLWSFITGTHTMKLKFLYLDIVNADCNQDRLEIYEGSRRARAPTITICNGTKVVEFTSKAAVELIYKGRSHNKYRGFLASVTYLTNFPCKGPRPFC